MFFYFFVFVALYVAIINVKDETPIYIKTKDLSTFPSIVSGGEDDETTDDFVDVDDDVDVDEVDSAELFQIEMKTNVKCEKVLYELHSYLSQRDINEETNHMAVEDDNIIWDMKFTSNIYDKFYDVLIEYINDNFLSENLKVYLNGKEVSKSIHLIK